ncbi:MAG: EamA family transporter [Rhizobiales bacterium]|nr:EamA family transporter [Hyphomicrobiales bacterium]
MRKAVERGSTRSIGIILVVISALLFSSAGLFAKGVQAGAWDIIFWRGLFAALFTTVYIMWRGSFRADFIGMGRSGWAVALVGASGTAAFIPAFKLTTIANVSLIYAATPLLAALLAWAWVGERLTRRVLIGCVAAFTGVAIIVSGSIGGVNLRGDLLAAWMTIALAILMVIYRRYPETPAAGPAVLSSLVLLPFGYTLGTPFSNSPLEIAIMATFGLSFAFASVTLSEGAKRLPAAETALLSILEVPLAPLFAWLIFTELPALATVMGGLLVLAGVVGTQIPSKANRASS